MNSIKQGTLFLIVGKSGAGKDSIIQKVITDWNNDKIRLRAATRFIARKAHGSEPYISASPEIIYRLKVVCHEN